MDDLSERDLSGVPDEDLTPEERQELRRRMGDFVERMQLRRLDEAADKAATTAMPEPAAKPQTEAKRHTRWDPPATTARGH